METTKKLTPEEEQALQQFANLLTAKYAVVDIIVYEDNYGEEEGDITNVAVILAEDHNHPFIGDVITDMAGIAYDIIFDKDMLIHPLPIWMDEWNNPEESTNYIDIKKIKNEGISLWQRAH
jgi:DNA polymerase, beta domain protein region